MASHSPKKTSPRSPQSQFPSRPYLPYSSPTASPTAPFNPKQVTIASAAALCKSKQKPKKPSTPYLNLSYDNYRDAISSSSPSLLQQQIASPRPSPVSKQGIAWARHSSIGFRLLQLLGSMALIIVVFLITDMDGFTAMVCRIPPAVAIVHIVYSIYHLSGKHRLLTPNSSKLYFLLSSTLDLAIICSYSFIGILAWRQYSSAQLEHLGTTPWTSVFDDSQIDRTLKLIVFILVCVTGGLTMVTLAITGYLIAVFRKLSTLSPEMNPFVDEKMVRDAQMDLSRDKNEKRWSQTSSTDSQTSFLKSNAIPFFAATKTKSRGPHAPAPGSQGRYQYQTLDVDEFGFGMNAERREEILGAGYGQDHKAEQKDKKRGVEMPSVAGLKRGRKVVRPLSIASLRGKKQDPRSTYASVESTPIDSEWDRSAGFEMSPKIAGEPNGTNTPTSWRSSVTLGHPNTALHPQGLNGDGPRFRRPSGEKVN